MHHQENPYRIARISWSPFNKHQIRSRVIHKKPLALLAHKSTYYHLSPCQSANVTWFNEMQVS